MQSVTEGLYHVSQINWADNTIYRAGIIPFYNKRDKILVGLGVTNITAVLVTLGGSFEDQDIDLFATAVREYNEETGSNISERDVADCYAVVNKGTINILLPLNDRPEFISNNEIERIVWLTTAQLQIISTNQDYFYRNREYIPANKHESSRLLTTSQSLLNELPLLITAIDCKLPTLRILCCFTYMRVKKMPEVKTVRVSTSFDQLRDDMANPSLFYGSASMAVRGDYVAFQRRDKVVYSFHIKHYDEFIKFVVTNKIKVYVGFKEEADKYFEFADSRRIISIERHLRNFLKTGCNTKQLYEIWRRFQAKIKGYRISNDIQSVTSEAILIHEVEEQIYITTENACVTSNTVRSSFMELLELANWYVLHIEVLNIRVLLSELQYYLSDQQRNKWIDPEDGIDVMTNLGLLSTTHNDEVTIY